MDEGSAEPPAQSLAACQPQFLLFAMPPQSYRDGRSEKSSKICSLRTDPCGELYGEGPNETGAASASSEKRPIRSLMNEFAYLLSDVGTLFSVCAGALCVSLRYNATALGLLRTGMSHAAAQACFERAWRVFGTC